MIPTMPTLSTPRRVADLPDAPPRLRVSLAEGRILQVNAAFCGLVGRAQADLVGTKFAALLAPSERAALAARLDGLVHFGRDRIAAVALEAHRTRIWCAIDAEYAPDADEAVDLRVARLRRGAQPSAGGKPSPLADPDDVGDAASEGPPASSPPAKGLGPAGGDAAAEIVGILDQLGHAALFVDGRWRVGAANAAAVDLLGAAPVALVGQPLTALFVLSARARAALDAAARAREVQTVRGGTCGGARVVALRWLPARDDGGYAVVNETFPQDPTTSRLKAATFQAKLITHDAQNQLVALRSALRQLRRRLPADHVDAHRALDDAVACNDEVADTFALSRDLTLDAARHCERLDAARQVRGEVVRHATAATRAGVELRTALADGLIIRAPGNWVNRIVGNLVDNALRHMPEGGVLAVDVRPEARDRPGALVVVADTGSGVPEADRERVFEEGYSRRPGGRGFGLYIVRHFTVSLGGQVHCAEHPGGGAAFHVWLPLAQDDAHRAEPTEATHG